ncbi:unnamed protein product [Urochloa decumbens]|uniref:Protein kinase domain-containing protein n=1 Tax=Urochloa decumbens TaxID=240449 RepID=A0ABC9BV13_9POAL
MHDAAVAAVHHALVAAVAAALLALAVALFLLWRRKRRATARSGSAAATAAAAAAPPLPVVPLADVERATDGFHPSRVIGQGRHFAVYAASPGIAAKRMHPHLVLGDPGGRRFPAAAARSLAVPPHPNLAAFVGLSEGPGERVLLVERAPAGAVSLDRLLGAGGDCAGRHAPATTLSWRQRAAVAAGAARGLAHLHAHGVVHGRVRPCNVLVSAAGGGGGAARITDYGLAGFLDGRDGDEARAEDDVYLFGAVLLELLTGRRWDGGRLADWALPQIRAGGGGGGVEVLDVARAGVPADKAEARLLARAARVALACVGNDGRSRPGMAEVAAILSDVEAAYRRCDGAPAVGEDEEVDGDGDEGRLSGCLLGSSRSVHKADMLLRPPV